MSLETAIVLATLITNVVGFAYTWFREGRLHRWATEDREIHSAVTNAKVDSSVKAAGEAYKEANDVNLKIKVLMKELSNLRKQRKRK